MRRTLLILSLLLSAPAAFAQELSREEQSAIQLYQSGKTEEALTAFLSIRKAQPANANAAKAIAQIYYGRDDFANAYKWASEGLRQEPGSPDFSIVKAGAALRLGKADESLALMEALLAKMPDIAYAQYIRGQALDHKGQKQQAIGAYGKAIAGDSDLLPAYRMRGAAFLDIGRNSDALKDLDHYLAAGAGDAAAYNLRGVAYSRLGRPQEAIADFTKSIALAPPNSTALNNRAAVYLDQDQTALALADYEQAWKADPANGEACYGLARIYNGQKDFGKALPLAERALSLSPGMAPYQAVYCAALIGLDRDREAIAAADKLIAIAPANTDGWIYKAAAQSNVKEYDASLATLNAAIDRIPDNYLLYALRAGVHRQKGDAAAAAADDNKARALSTK